MAPPSKKPPSREEREGQPLFPDELAEIREIMDARRRRAWLRRAAWHFIGWAGAGLAVLSQFKDTILDWIKGS